MAANRSKRKNNKRTCLSAGIVINEILTHDEDVKAIARCVFPVAKDKAELPYVAYRRTQLASSPIKNGKPSDSVYMEVMCYSKDYSESIDLAESVRAALDCKAYVTDDGLKMRSCILTDSEEGWADDAYLQQLVFEIKI